MPPTIPLNFPPYPFRIRKKEGKEEIFDAVRKKYVRLTPEEWVRQHLIMYLHTELGYPLSLIAVEKRITLHGMSRRFDVAVFDLRGQPLMLTECKAPNVPILQEVMDQAGRYNLVLKVPYLCVTNGLTHYFCRRIPGKDAWEFLEQIPAFATLND